MNLGLAIKTARKSIEPNINQSEFAERLGVTQSYLSLIENNVKTPSIKLLERISKEFNIPLSVIFWMGIEPTDVSDDKRKDFRFLKPCIDSLIRAIY